MVYPAHAVVRRVNAVTRWWIIGPVSKELRRVQA
jgi:hypothetical protein